MVAVAAVALDGNDGRIDVVTRGGTGQVEIEGKNAWLTGPVEYVFSGEVGQA
jgi:diaminopimelate epimerase